MLKNFKYTVPALLQNKIKDFAEYVQDNWSDIVTQGESQGEISINEIEGNYRSGWLPSQDGGFSADCFYSGDQGHELTKKQKEFNSADLHNCFVSFLSINDMSLSTEWDELTEDQQQEYCNYESEWVDPALVQMQIFCEGWHFWTKEKTVTIRLSINYVDAPYYREKHAEDIKTIIMTYDEFMNQDNQSIINQIKI